MTERLRQGVLWQGRGFRVTAGGLGVTGQPALGDWAEALRACVRGRSAYQWAVGDLLLYADARGWADEAVEEVMDATGLKRGSLLNMKSVARAFPAPRRRLDLPWSHHQLVTSLPEEEADRLLDVAAETALGWEEVREHARSARHAAARERGEQAWPAGTFGLLLASPPWSTGERAPAWDTDRVAALAPRVQAVTAPEAVLYLHAANAQLEDALRVAQAWGFTVRGAHAVTSSVPLRTTEFMRERHELLLVATRGRFVGPEQPPDSVLLHGTVADVLERAYAGLPRLLLFAGSRVGWTTWDHEAAAEEPAARAIRVRAPEAEAASVSA